ncbi:MAG: ATP-binding protein [Oscillospiraceae bacterium]|jgi:signal transduction histidine kinase
MKQKKVRHLFRVRQLKWVFFLSISVVIGAVMAFGLIGMFAFHFDTHSSIYMLGMIPLMILILGYSLWISLRSMEKKLLPVLNGLQQVAEGDVEVKLDVKNAGEYEKIYENFNTMTAELKATKEEMQNFVNEFAHEFKTPITSIRGFAEHLYETGEGIETEERMEYLEVIYQQSGRLANLSQNTLLLSKLEGCQILTDKTEFLLSEQIKCCAILLLKEMERKHITLHMPEEFEFSYYGNEELMEQIWINLLNNAIKFTPENGEITISAETLPNEVKISVSDTGIGMTAETQKHIFEKYYQNDTSSLTKGSGIGLSIVKRITELCGGDVTVHSKLHQGSTFTIHLPLGRTE